MKSQYGAKRAIDIGLSIIMLSFLFPVFIFISIGIMCCDGRPVFYKHERVGQNGRRFGCLKFRTMVKDSQERLEKILTESPEARAEWEGSQKLKNDPRIISNIGQLLRKSSLDELPQLFNVIRGEMSLVGPRPVTEVELSRYGKFVVYYLALRPGITGPWQISGRSDVDYEGRVQLDVSYASRLSIAEDLRIIATTLPAVIVRRGAY